VRDNSISIAKAIGIMLMVLAHSRFSVYGNYWINMFHMPLFFFFAGYCFKEKYLSEFKTFALNRIRGIYKPYVKWGLIFLLLHNVFFSLLIYNDKYGYQGGINHAYTSTDFYHHALLIVTAMRGHDGLLGGYWFLKSLFWSSFIGYLSIRYISRQFQTVLCLLATITLCFFNLKIPYFQIGSTETLGATFYLIGYYMKTTALNFNLNITNSIILSVLSLVLITIGMQYWQATMKTVMWWEVVPYTITAIMGTITVFVISKHIDKSENSILKNALIYIGNTTLTILTWHFLCFKLVSFVIVLVYNLPLERIGEHPAIEEYSMLGWFIAYFVVGITIPQFFSKFKFLR